MSLDSPEPVEGFPSVLLRANPVPELVEGGGLADDLDDGAKTVIGCGDFRIADVGRVRIRDHVKVGKCENELTPPSASLKQLFVSMANSPYAFRKRSLSEVEGRFAPFYEKGVEHGAEDKAFSFVAAACL